MISRNVMNRRSAGVRWRHMTAVRVRSPPAKCSSASRRTGSSVNRTKRNRSRLSRAASVAPAPIGGNGVSTAPMRSALMRSHAPNMAFQASPSAFLFITSK